jgi:fluoroacetyl-CoA thioesterase
MKTSLVAGLTHALDYRVTDVKTVPHVYPESDLFVSMPAVFATAYMVGLIEWACMEAIRAHLEPGEQTVGTDIRVSHTAATPPGLTVRIDVEVERVEGRRISFRVKAHDGVEPIGEGTHERFVIDPARFARKVADKAARGQDRVPSGSG